MGIYFNPGNYSFQRALNSQIYVDKSLLIEYTNKVINTQQSYLCVSRPRRFGKSTDANMLVAYYSKGCDSTSIFDSLKISNCQSYKKYLNQLNVIHLNMQDFLSESKDMTEMIDKVQIKVLKELSIYFKDYCLGSLTESLYEIFTFANEQFIFIIDEWDCVLRVYSEDKEAQKQYLDFLRTLLKDKPYVALAYMTGILPIKKYGTHNALNMFDEVSMIDPLSLSQFMGFTENEVNELCEQHKVDYEMMKLWYDGYHLKNGISVYNPKSVVTSLLNNDFGNYWTQTETYEALKVYINQNIDGLKNLIVSLLAGNEEKINVARFVNDMTTLNSKDDVLTLLIHLGYLGYNNINKTVYIPNREVRDSFIAAIDGDNYKEINQIVENSYALLEATWNLDERKVAEYINIAHMDTSIVQYNDENALAYTISLAYISARNYYTFIREMPTGKGFADLVLLPIGNKPAMVIELKWDKDVETAISQIKNKEYMFGLEKYKNNLLLVGINYNKKTKEHTCSIEQYK